MAISYSPRIIIVTVYNLNNIFIINKEICRSSFVSSRKIVMIVLSCIVYISCRMNYYILNCYLHSNMELLLRVTEQEKDIIEKYLHSNMELLLLCPKVVALWCYLHLHSNMELLLLGS